MGVNVAAPGTEGGPVDSHAWEHAQQAAAAASCAQIGVGLENTEANQRIKLGGVRAGHERDVTCEEYLAKLVNPEIFYLKYLPAGLFFVLFWVWFFL